MERTGQYSVSIPSLESLRDLAERITDLLVPGDVIGLRGELGAGKTEFVRSIAAVLDCPETVTSPTYVLEHVYPISLEHSIPRFRAIYHWDLYRLNGEGEDLDLFDSSYGEDGLVLVEWPERIPEVIELLSLEIVLSVVSGSEERLASINWL